MTDTIKAPHDERSALWAHIAELEKIHDKRVSELLAYNNAEVERRRQADKRVKELEGFMGYVARAVGHEDILHTFVMMDSHIDDLRETLAFKDVHIRGLLKQLNDQHERTRADHAQIKELVALLEYADAESGSLRDEDGERDPVHGYPLMDAE